MNNQWNPNGLVTAGFAAALGLMLFGAAACAQAAAPFSAQQREQAIQQLSDAEKQDYSNANRQDIGPVDREDYLVQAKTAEQTINELEHGNEVPQREIQDAMVVPHRPRTPQETAELIKKLKQAKAMDEIGVSDRNSGGRARTQDFAVQAQKADDVLKELESGEAVSQVLITDALQVPRNP